MHLLKNKQERERVCIKRPIRSAADCYDSASSPTPHYSTAYAQHLPLITFINTACCKKLNCFHFPSVLVYLLFLVNFLERIICRDMRGERTRCVNVISAFIVVLIILNLQCHRVSVSTSLCTNNTVKQFFLLQFATLLPFSSKLVQVDFVALLFLLVVLYKRSIFFAFQSLLNRSERGRESQQHKRNWRREGKLLQ